MLSTMVHLTRRRLSVLIASVVTLLGPRASQATGKPISLHLPPPGTPMVKAVWPEGQRKPPLCGCCLELPDEVGIAPAPDAATTERNLFATICRQRS